MGRSEDGRGGEPAVLETAERLRVEIQGAVQGVGFRPFVYRLATDLALTGWVINDTRGVFIEVEGPRPQLEEFRRRLRTEAPPRALIEDLQAAWLAPAGFACFEIRHSEDGGSKTVLVLPDIATCPQCLAEIRDPANRRYGYPFTNCTDCGPRFTIIQALPYDRPNTTMRRFTLCPDCAAEYTDPLDRRFHAQPNACPTCGPELAFYRRSTVAGLPSRPEAGGPPPATAGRWPETVVDWSLAAMRGPALDAAVALLRGGGVVAVKGLGGFHLMAGAAEGEAIGRLRAGKPRREKPFALMARDLAQVRQICEVPDEAVPLLTGPAAPIVLLRRRPDARVAEEVAPGNPYLGVMLAYTPLHHLLLAGLNGPVVATSGNLTDEPICIDEWEALARLGHLADAFLIHDRPIERHVDDSVATILAGSSRLLRRARGYAPLPVLLSEEAPVILATGPHLKNTVALSLGKRVFISQHIGDLETPEALAAFERVIADFLRLYEAQPVAIAHDLHPEYASTQWAVRQAEAAQGREARRAGHAPEIGDPLDGKLPRALIGVQHHHAHLAACLAENGWQGPALGVTWDGTGYGTDGTIWGGEFLLGDAASFTRVAHLRTFRLPGGEAAIHEPARLALALLWELYGEGALAWDDLAPVAAFRPAGRRVLAQMLQHGLNAPVTSAAGRLFDGIAALAGLHQRVTFEGQAAMALEFVAAAGVREAYPVQIAPEHSAKANATDESGAAGRTALAEAAPSLLVDWAPLVEAVLADVRRGTPVDRIAARFHNALVDAIAGVAEAIGRPTVALTGGCFQNRRLTEDAAGRLRAAGFEVLLHRQVPPNDGGISLGQVAVAAARLRRGASAEV